MESLIDIDEYIKNFDRFKMYNREESSTFEKIIKKMDELNSYYNTSNFKKLDELLSKISYKFDVINLNNYDNEIILSNNLKDYIKSANKSEQLFSDVIK